MFGIELIAPFLIFLPRRARFLAFWLFALLQVTIALTGNYTFFNLLTLVLGVPLLDDAALLRCLPRSLGIRFGEAVSAARTVPHRFLRVGRFVMWAAVAAVVLAMTAFQTALMFRADLPWPATMIQLYNWTAPLRSVNSYGLFRVMTTTRPEIIVEGSNDGTNWQAYEFRYKPGDLKRRPRFVAPHQPRLDWQMWFAALGHYRANPWFIEFCLRLLRGSPQVIALLEHNPFPEAPPTYIRATLYEYHFTDLATRRVDGTWWRREYKGPYCPVLSLKPQQGQ
jgi:hypothetical protein